MKNLYAIICISLLGLSSYAQEETEVETTTTETEEVGDTTVIRLKNYKITLEEAKCKNCDSVKESKRNWRGEGHWAGIDVGVNVLMNQNGTTEFNDNLFLEIDPARSWNWNLNFAEHRFSIAKQHVGITTGLGLNISNFSFKNDYVYAYTTDTITAAIDTVASYDKNKLRLAYLTIPLLVEFNTHKNPSKSFYLSVGAVGGVKIMSKLKRTTDQDGYESRFSEKGEYGVNPFKLDAMVRLGYSDWGVYASYNLIPLLDKRLTSEAYHASFGLSYSF